MKIHIKMQMDSLFSQPNTPDRNTRLRSLIQSFGCSYICLWSYLPPPTHRLFFFDGYFHEDNTNQPGSSAGSLARRLFDEYRSEIFSLANDRVPGMAFINNQPYRELNQLDLQIMASIAVQRQFYQEAKIKTAVFLGCRSGEIEMGWSNGTRDNMENWIRTWFPDDIISHSRQQSPLRELSQAVDPNRVSSTSSSSLRSLSMDSPDCTSLLFNLPSSTSHKPETVVSLEPSASLQPIPGTSSPPIHRIVQYLQQIHQTTTGPLHLQPIQSLQQQQQTPSTTAPLPPHQSTSPHHQAMQAFAPHLPNQQREDEAITQAILAVLTCPSFTSSSSSNLPHPPQFKKYRAPTTPARHNPLRQTMFKRTLTFYRNLHIARRDHMMSSRPTSTQLHHMISERKRREKINESFEALRKLLPPEAKKDKASVLTRTREYLTLLKDQAEKLNERNRQLEAQLLLPTEDSIEASSERIEVRITHVAESTSDEQRIINLQVVLRGECLVSDMVIRILEFLKQVQNVNLMSMEASTLLQESVSSTNRVILRLQIEGNEWDESAFQEAVRRVVADLL